MSGSATVAIITVAGSIVVAALSFFLTKWSERKAEWQKRKIEHYTELFSSISDLTGDAHDKDEANRRFNRLYNTSGLVVPQYVMDALIEYQLHVGPSSPDRSWETANRLLVRLLLAVRKDIGVSGRDNAKTFRSFMLSSAPPEKADQARRR
jgi:hypothetical protein